MVLHISAYSIHCLWSPFSTTSLCFVIRAYVGDDILDFSSLLIVLANLDALCSITPVMVSLVVSMSCSLSSVWFRSWCPCPVVLVVSGFARGVHVL